MNVTPEVRAAQEAYAARPFAVRWVDSHLSTTFRFHTLDGAFEYAQAQWALIQKRVRENRCMASEIRRCYIESPTGRMPLAYWLLCNDVSSY